jgi:hypothetical protein
MAYSEQRKKYANEWYAKNKERLKSLAHRKEAKRISDKKYYEKNKADLKEKSKKWRLDNPERYKSRKKIYYEENRERLILRQREKRETIAYKLYMKEYRAKNKIKISQQERVKGKEWIKKQVDLVSDAYVITLLTNVKTGLFKTHEEAKQHPDLIEIRKNRILINRIKKQIKLRTDG